MRRSLSTTQRLHLFLTAQGHCQACGWRLHPAHAGRWTISSPSPWAGGMPPTTSRCSARLATARRPHAAIRPRLSKAKRMQARHLGAARSKAVIPGSRRSGYKKKINGEVVRGLRR